MSKSKNLAVCITLLMIPIMARAETPAVAGPLSLSDAVQTALKYSPMIQSAAYQASAAEAHVVMTRAMTKPQISALGITGKSNLESLITTPPNVGPWSITHFPTEGKTAAQLMLMYPIYTGGRLSATIKGAKALSSAAGSDRAAVERNVSMETKMAYHRALLADAFVSVYEELVKEAQERVRIAEASFNEGKIAKYDLLRNQAELADAQQQLTNAQRDAQIALVDLKAVLGMIQASDITLSDKLEYAPVTGSLDSYMATAIKNRPEPAAARARINSNGSNLDVAKSAYKPQVYLNAMEMADSGAEGNESGYAVAVSVGLPLLDGGERRAAVKEAEAMLEAMKREEQQALLGVQQDVSTVWAELQAADRNVQLSKAAVVQAEEDYRVVKLRYESGKTINVEVLDALFSLVRAQTNELSALYDHNIARDRLARAVGEI